MFKKVMGGARRRGVAAVAAGAVVLTGAPVVAPEFTGGRAEAVAAGYVGPVGRWHFDETDGAAVDSSTTDPALQDNALLSGGAVRDDRGRRGETRFDDGGAELPQPKVDRGLALDGASGHAATSGPVLDTSAGYTVAAWVRADSGTGSAVVLSQDGDRYSPFALSRESNGRWRFGVKEDEGSGAAYRGVQSEAPALPNVWTHLAGSYDPATGSLRLYVNGALQGTATVFGTWAAKGALQFGRLKWDTAHQRYFSGSIDEAAAWQRVLPPEEIVAEARTESSSTGRPYVELVADWNPAGASGTSLPDTRSGYGGSLALEGGAALDGTSLTLDGASGAATAPAPLVDPTGSFTMTAKVQLDEEKLLAKDVGYVGQVAGQRAADGSAWGLWYELVSKETRTDGDVTRTHPLGVWHFGRVGKDGAKSWVSSDELADVSSPVQLTGVFDALSWEGEPVVSLYVGSDRNDLEMPYTPASGPGEFAVGKGFSAADWGHFLPGRVSDVRLWAGAMRGSGQIADTVGTR